MAAAAAMAVAAASAAARPLLLVAGGAALKRAGWLVTGDGEVLLRVAATMSLPALIFVSTATGGWVGYSSVLLVAGLHSALLLAAGWVVFRERPPRERALLMGSLCGTGAGTFGAPIISAAFGDQGLLAARAFGAVSMAAACAAGYVILASGGDGGRYKGIHKHADGGVYDGEWGGGAPPSGRKEGSGVYVYPSGARFDGEWRDNGRDGRGVYMFPKGGMYEGEWSGGQMQGVGVRTFSDGRLKAGRWVEGKLQTALPRWQCENAAKGAREAAAAAHVAAGARTSQADAVFTAAVSPAAVALAAGLLAQLLGNPVPAAIDSVLVPLADSAAPCALLAVGLLLPTPTASPEAGRAGGTKPRGLTALQRRDAAAALGIRYGVSLLAGAAATATLGGAAGLAAPVAGAAALAMAMPAAEVAVLHSLRWRNDGGLAALIVGASCVVSAAIAAGLIFAYSAAGAAGLARACAAGGVLVTLVASSVRVSIGPREVKMSLAAGQRAGGQAGGAPPTVARDRPGQPEGPRRAPASGRLAAASDVAPPRSCLALPRWGVPLSHALKPGSDPGAAAAGGRSPLVVQVVARARRPRPAPPVPRLVRLVLA